MADAVNIATGPGDLDSVADSPLYTRWGCLEFLSDGRIQGLGDGAQNLDIVVHHGNGFTQILITLDMCRYTDFMNDGRDVGIKVFALGQRHHIV
ncbi:hypothetical protein D3C86_2017670 [compost metagenome]